MRSYASATAPAFPAARRPGSTPRVGWFLICFMLLMLSIFASGCIVYLRDRACATSLSKLSQTAELLRSDMDDARRQLLTTANSLAAAEAATTAALREKQALQKRLDEVGRAPAAAPNVAPVGDAVTVSDVHGVGRGDDAHGNNFESAPVPSRDARALLIICYNRPDYLRRTLQRVHDNMPLYNRPHVYISQDGDEPGVTAVIGDFKTKFARSHADVPFTHMKHPPVNAPAGWMTGYYKLAQHFGWALNALFNDFKHRFVIVLEDDLDIAPDFFDYFTACEEMLLNDRTLLAASAWNDIGQAAFVKDAKVVRRSDFFPGLGWMLSRHAWEELGPKWPEAFWDDWLREPPQRKGRAFLHPEVSRTYTFGEQGTSASQFFDAYLANIKLNDERVAWAHEDLSYLDKAAYDTMFTDAVRKAREVDAGAVVAEECKEGGGVKVYYDSVERGYPALAQAFGFIDDVKAGVPRTAYMGVVTIQHRGCTKYITPRGTGL